MRRYTASKYNAGSNDAEIAGSESNLMKKRNIENTDEMKRRAKYLRSRGGNLTSFGVLLGQSFEAKVNLLGQLIRGAHAPTLGHYKEQLLAAVIRESIPTDFAVGSGFILFPTRPQNVEGKPPRIDSRQSGDHDVSHQCDIIVYDRARYPVIFRDGDFVVVRPESVRAIIEVKGTLTTAEVKSTMKNFIDLGNKWDRCDSLYREMKQPSLPEVRLFLMAWQVHIDKKGRPATDGHKLRKEIVNCYQRLDLLRRPSFPILTAAFIYNESEVSQWMGLYERKVAHGFATMSGRVDARVGEAKIALQGDGTVASLVSLLRLLLDMNRYNPLIESSFQLRPSNAYSGGEGISVLVAADAADSPIEAWLERKMCQ